MNTPTPQGAAIDRLMQTASDYRAARDQLESARSDFDTAIREVVDLNVLTESGIARLTGVGRIVVRRSLTQSAQ